jgi:DNA polymerase delta subunit 2
MPIHILPGEHDPSGAILPQQPFPRGLFGAITSSPAFRCESNPTYIRLAAQSEQSHAKTLLVHSGQPLNDMFKYLATPPHTKLSIMESTLRWRHMAPTAPDTLWCHPYREEDPFIMKATPDIYIAGGQDEFATKMVQDEYDSRRQCRLVMVPKFAQTGLLVLVNLRSLDVKTVCFTTRGFS